MDSARWDGFARRPGDILVCTAYKAGTTWTQMICALLIFQTPRLPRPLAELSPWFELRLYPREELHARYAAQSHRRFIKTHTPLDGLPWDPAVTYLVCGRDPRDIFISMQNHKENQNLAQVVEILRSRGESLPPPPDVPTDLDGAFQAWMTRGSFPWEQDGYPFWSVFHHVETFWAQRHLPNVHFLHYADLKADLEGEMRRLAGVLGIDVPEARWPSLVEAAGFEAMKRNADQTAPDTDLGMWRDNAGFFHTGESGRGRALLGPESLDCYARVTAARKPPEMIAWLERGGRATADPKTLT